MMWDQQGVGYADEVAEERALARDDVQVPEESAPPTANDGVCEPEGAYGLTPGELGRRGEDAAARFLERRGYEIVDRNWCCAAGEADIVAIDREVLVFVEVKTRTSLERGLPEEAVDAEKRSRYERIAALYLACHDYVDMQVRFDVVALLVSAPDRALIRHHINAFGTGE